MPRAARFVLSNQPHYIVQRESDQNPIYFDEEDGVLFLDLLKKYLIRYPSKLHAYSMLASENHFLITPLNAQYLSKIIQGVTLRYTQHINRKYNRKGPMWKSRYLSAVVDRKDYFWTVISYIERRPVKTNVATDPTEYMWGSAWVRSGKETEINLSLDPLEVIDKKYIQNVASQDDDIFIEKQIKSSRPIGSAKFISDLENRYHKKLSPLKRGRPLKDCIKPKRA